MVHFKNCFTSFHQEQATLNSLPLVNAMKLDLFFKNTPSEFLKSITCGIEDILLFGIKLQSIVSCKCAQSTIASSNHILVHVPIDAVDLPLCVQKLLESKQCTCASCNANDALVTTSLQTVPSMVIFNFENKKSNLILQEELILFTNTRYTLTSVIVELNTNHFSTFAKHNDKWYYFKECNYIQVSFSDVLIASAKRTVMCSYSIGTTIQKPDKNHNPIQTILTASIIKQQEFQFTTLEIAGLENETFEFTFIHLPYQRLIVYSKKHGQFLHFFSNDTVMIDAKLYSYCYCAQDTMLKINHDKSVAIFTHGTKTIVFEIPEALQRVIYSLSFFKSSMVNRKEIVKSKYVLVNCILY